jgi:nucleoside-diphosphate-sugar epimerase
LSAPLALVTGASGFVGSHVADALLGHGARVRCLLRATSSRRWLEGKPVELAEGDVTRAAGLDEALRGVDWIVHAAGLTHAPTPAEFHRANAEGTRNLIDAALRMAPAPRRFVYISSQAAAGPSPSGAPVVEGDPPRPVSAYGESKLAGERLVMDARDRLPVTTIRPPTVYGPRETVLLKYFRAIRHHVRPYLGSARPFSIVYAPDLAAAVLAALHAERAAGQVYFVGGPDVTGYREMGDAIAAALGTWAVRLPIPSLVLAAGALVAEAAASWTGREPFLTRAKVREVLAGDWIVSSRKIREELGWAPATSLTDGVRATAAWYREAGWV